MPLFSSLLLNLSIGILAQVITKLSLAKANVNIIGQQVVICQVNASQTLFASSFMKAFRLRRDGVDVVRTCHDTAAWFIA